MNALRKLYLDFYLVVYALYAFFNKGIAYSYLTEVLWALGVVFVLKDLRKLELLWNSSMKLLVAFLAVSVLYILRGIGGNPVGEVLRDSFILNYAVFVLILFYFKDQAPYIWKGLFKIYTWFPWVALVSFLLISFVPFFETFVVFGKIPLLVYKYNDIGGHLLIAALFWVNGKINLSPKWALAQITVIVYMFLVASSYSRSGMLAFGVGLAVFYFFDPNKKLKTWVLQYIRFLPILLATAFLLYAMTQVGENFQGRKIGLDQLKENAVSIVSSNTEGTLADNKVWRLTWWAKIISDSFSSAEMFLFGRGYGMSLAAVNEIDIDDDTLRSPHSIHLNYLARFGYPFLLAWLAWLYLLFCPLWRKTVNTQQTALLAILAAFVINASFDVYFEGPMGSFPFWTFVGLYYIELLQKAGQNKEDWA